MHWLVKTLLAGLVLVGLGVIGVSWYLSTYDDREVSRVAFMEGCASCHGRELEGSSTGPSLKTTDLKYGDGTQQLITSIQERHELQPAKLTPSMTKALALFIIERRQRLPSITQSHNHKIPTGVVVTEHHDFRVETLVELPSGPYSMEPLPDGRILVAEKVRGLSVVDQNGQQGPLIAGTPEVWGEIIHIRGSYVGLGQMLDVELHPDYATNGWIYFSHTDRCQLDCGSPWPRSMVRVVRGRLAQNQWVDQEIVWAVHKDNYTVVPDGVAGGRLAFDGSDDLYVTVGGKSTYDNLHVMDTPYGKIHRVHDDGRTPTDNPFWKSADERSAASARNTVFSYGHRTTQGLSTDPRTGLIWSTEMGPRGGDEVNRIQAGGNYGWPLYTHGLDYNAKPVSIGTDLGLDFPVTETILPVVDFTPAPSLSNFTFYEGARFEEWENDLLVGSLRAQTLFRIRLNGDQIVELESLITHLGRIRDVEIGPDGLVYVLLEHGKGGSIVKLVPAD
ncbi:MAG: PQQ-dependent sugar dehydrogenase [Pseudomonadota bacterium]